MNSDKSEIIRKKYKYRRLILTGKISLSHKNASSLIGPDCAYHLYSRMKTRIKIEGEKNDA